MAEGGYCGGGAAGSAGLLRRPRSACRPWRRYRRPAHIVHGTPVCCAHLLRRQPAEPRRARRPGPARSPRWAPGSPGRINLRRCPPAAILRCPAAGPRVSVAHSSILLRVRADHHQLDVAQADQALQLIGVDRMGLIDAVAHQQDAARRLARVEQVVGHRREAERLLQHGQRLVFGVTGVRSRYCWCPARRAPPSASGTVLRWSAWPRPWPPTARPGTAPSRSATRSSASSQRHGQQAAVGLAHQRRAQAVLILQRVLPETGPSRRRCRR